MFNLTSISALHYQCPDCCCQKAIVKKVFFQGIHILAVLECTCCDEIYYQTLPTGHGAVFPITFSVNKTNAVYDKRAELWMAKPLIESILQNKFSETVINKEVFDKRDKIILLNCLDSCYGHVLLKLLNAQKYLDKNKESGLVLLIPTSFRWLVPEGVAEVWTVKAPLISFDQTIKGLDEFVHQQLPSYKEVYISSAHIHPDLSNIEISRFTGTKIFDLEKFSKVKPTITFICREDRFWLDSKLDALFLKACIKYNKLKYFKRYFVRKQNKLFNRVAVVVKASIDNTEFYAAGLGKSGSLDKLIRDLRSDSISDDLEKKWCELYSTSHAVIGIHGSNMLLPTAHAAGFIEILPDHKIEHITEDIAMNRNSRYSQFLGRYVDEFSDPEKVALHAITMINNFSFLYKNTEESKK